MLADCDILHTSEVTVIVFAVVATNVANDALPITTTYSATPIYDSCFCCPYDGDDYGTSRPARRLFFLVPLEVLLLGVRLPQNSQQVCHCSVRASSIPRGGSHRWPPADPASKVALAFQSQSFLQRFRASGDLRCCGLWAFGLWGLQGLRSAALQLQVVTGVRL